MRATDWGAAGSSESRSARRGRKSYRRTAPPAATGGYDVRGAFSVCIVLLVGSCNAIFGVEDFTYEGSPDPDPVGGGGGAGQGGAAGSDQGGAAGGGAGAGAAGGSGGAGGQGAQGAQGGQGGGAGFGGAAGAGGSEPSCTEQFGAAQNFELCQETPIACDFYVNSGAQSCDGVCASFGGSCSDAWNDAGAGQHCVHDGGVHCWDGAYEGIICQCTRD